MRPNWATAISWPMPPGSDTQETSAVAGLLWSSRPHLTLKLTTLSHPKVDVARRNPLVFWADQLFHTSGLPIA
jgi:hypothetical protein